MAAPVRTAMVIDEPLLVSPTNAAPAPKAPSRQAKPTVHAMIAGQFRTGTARATAAMAPSVMRVPRTVWMASAGPPSESAFPNAARIPSPRADFGVVMYRLTPAPRVACTTSPISRPSSVLRRARDSARAGLPAAVTSTWNHPFHLCALAVRTGFRDQVCGSTGQAFDVGTCARAHRPLGGRRAASCGVPLTQRPFGEQKND